MAKCLPNKREIRPTRRKAGSLSEKAGFMFGYDQLERSAKGDLSSHLESNFASSGKMKKESGNYRANKKVNDE